VRHSILPVEPPPVRSRRVTRRGWALFGAMCVIWGIPYLLIKVAVAEVNPVALVFLRTAMGAALLVPVAAARGQLAPLLPRWRMLVAYTVIEIGLPWVLLSHAEQRLSSSLSGLLVAAVPLIGAVIAAGVGQERIDSRRLVGLLVGLAGVAVLLGFDVSSGDLGAVGEMGVVATCYAIGPLIISRQLADLPAMGVVAASLGLAAVAYAPVALLHLPSHVPPANVVAALVVLGVLCTAIAFLVFFALIAEAGPVRATVITYVNPAVAVALGVLLLGERFTVATAVGFVLILLGCALATRRSAATRATQTPPMPAPVECALD
jgi:drug/metabolite transporter (DMT)-like permease